MPRLRAGKQFPRPVRLGCNGAAGDHKCRNPARFSRICLECAAIFGHLPLTVRCRLGDYTRAMMIKQHSDDLCCRGGRRGGNLARAGAGLSGIAPGAVYSTAPQPYPPGGYPADYRRGSRRAGFRCAGRRRGAERAEFDGAVAARTGAFAGRSALRPPERSPADLFRPRCADRPDPVARRSALWPPAGAPPVYSDRGAPTGPILSPDDPRYGRAADPRRSIPTARRPVRFFRR